MYQVAGAGDVNGDNIPDIAIGLKSKSVRADGRGWILLGHETMVSDDVQDPVVGAFDIYSSQRHSDIGIALDGIGDFNGDGFDDVLFGVPFVLPTSHPHARGHAYVVFGSGATASVDLKDLGSHGLRIRGQRDNHVGLVATGVADVNNDGRTDIAFTGFKDELHRSAAWIVLGHKGAQRLTVGQLGSLGFKVVHPDYGIASVGGGNDINGDDCDDLLFGLPDASSDRGKVFGIFSAC
jgi:hypothetical protein